MNNTNDNKNGNVSQGIMIDNTGLHAVKRCLDKRASEYDIENLMQFAIMIAFADKITISGHKKEDILANSLSAIKTLKEEFSVNIIEVISTNENEYIKMLHGSIEDFVNDTLKTNSEIDGLKKAGKINPEGKKKYNPNEWAWDILNTNDESTLNSEMEIALQDKAWGDFRYALSYSKELREIIIEKSNSLDWENKKDFMFNIDTNFRILRNMKHAVVENQVFNHSVSRQVQFLKHYSKFFNAVDYYEKLIESEVEPILFKKPDISIFSDYLIHKSMGDQSGIISEAWIMRSQVGKLKDALLDLMSDYQFNASKNSQKYDEKIRKLVSEHISRFTNKKYLGVDKNTTQIMGILLPFALGFDFFTENPSFSNTALVTLSLIIPKLKDHIEYLSSKKNYSIISNIVDEIEKKKHQSTDSDYLTSLYNNCGYKINK